MARTRTITYNGFTFPYTRLRVQEEPLYAEDGFTQIGADYTFSVSGSVIGTSAADFRNKLAAMRGALQLPRNAFTVQLSDDSSTETLFQFGAGHDDDWGPIVHPLLFSQFAHTSCRYDWSVKCQKKEKWSGSEILDSDVVLALCRRYSFSVDQSGFTTRTVSGSLTVSSRGGSADQYRALVVPSVPAWFRRTSQSFETSVDSRTLNFVVTDTETMWTLPGGITEGQASFHVHLEPSAIVSMTLSGFFAAPIDVWKPSIIEHIRNLIDQRFPESTFFESFDLTDDVYSNRITFSVAGKAGGTADPTGGDPGTLPGLDQLAGFGQRPPDSTGVSTVPNPYGGHGLENSGVTAGDAVLYDAAGAQTFADPNGTVPAGVTGTADAGDDKTGPANPESGKDDGVSDEQKASPYIHYHEQISYEIDNGIKIFSPKVAASAGAGPLIQQTHAPIMKIIQAGTATRLSRTMAYLPQVPKPIYAPSDRIVLQAYISPTSGEVVNSDFSRFTVNWRYIMVATSQLGSSTEQPRIYVPTTPIRPEQPDQWTIPAPLDQAVAQTPIVIVALT